MMGTTTPSAAGVRPYGRGDRAAIVSLAVAFAVAHTQSPLFFSNQNQYLLHGLAHGGLGQLRSDWLANTADPTPLFSWGVRIGFELFGPRSLQAAYSILLMAYFLVVVRLLEGAFPAGPDRGRRLAFAAAFIALHAAVFRIASVRLTGVDYPWYLQAGVAGQYLLGPGLQPSAFGVMLLAGLAAFLHRRPFLAVALQSLACATHATYLLPSALLTLGYAATLIAEGRARAAIAVGMSAAVGALPTIAYILARFAPTTPEAFAEAQEILADVRIPHHARVERWLDAVAGLQMAWMALGIAFARGTRLFPVLAVATLGGLGLTLAQWASGNATFALLFPWRISAVLAPVAAAVIVWRAVACVPASRGFRRGFSIVLLAASTVGGAAIGANGRGYATNGLERELLDFVKDAVRPGDIYLLPVRVPTLGSGAKGSLSTSFTPAPRPRAGSNLIPVDLQRFRLMTGAPIYVDFKAVPYKDVEVLEWRRRLAACGKWYDANWSEPGVREQLHREGIGFVVVPIDGADRVDWLEPVYADAAYAVFRVR